MSETPDGPERTAEDSLSADDDLLALLAPGSPTTEPAGPAAPPAVTALPDRAAMFEPSVRRPRRTYEPLEIADTNGADLVAPAEGAATASFGPMVLRAAAVPGSGGAAPLRIGSRFGPIPGTLPAATGPAAVDPDVGPLPLVAPAGTPVHAIEAGTVTLADPLRLAADSGFTYLYGGIAAGSAAVSDGAHVDAGTILGTVAATRLSRTVPPPQPHLRLQILDAAGDGVDVAEFLVGLADPNELGHAAVGAGLDVDPDALDREIASASLGVP